MEGRVRAGGGGSRCYVRIAREGDLEEVAELPTNETGLLALSTVKVSIVLSSSNKVFVDCLKTKISKSAGGSGSFGWICIQVIDNFRIKIYFTEIVFLQKYGYV